MNPFDIRSVLFAKHAQHVVLIHFPIALFIVGVGFDLLARRSRNTMLAAAAYFNLLLAAFAALPVVVTGLLAWHYALEGATLKGILLWHLLSASVVTILIALTAHIHHRAHRDKTDLPFWRVPLEAVTILLVGLTAHLGGFLSGVNT